MTSTGTEADRAQLLGRLFAVLTVRLEDAAAVAADGQSSRLTVSERAVLASRLASATVEIATIAEAAEAITEAG